MEKLSNRDFFMFASNGYFPVSITTKHAFYIHFSGVQKISKDSKLYLGSVFELHGNSFDPLLLISVRFSSRNIKVWNVNFSAPDDIHVPYVIYEYCPCLFLPCTNYNKFLHFLTLSLNSLLSQNLF